MKKSGNAPDGEDVVYDFAGNVTPSTTPSRPRKDFEQLKKTARRARILKSLNDIHEAKIKVNQHSNCYLYLFESGSLNRV